MRCSLFVVALFTLGCMSPFDRMERMSDRAHERQMEQMDRFMDQMVSAKDAFEAAKGCKVTSEPSGALLQKVDRWGHTSVVGYTPLTMDRPLRDAQLVQAQMDGHIKATGYVLSREVHGDCQVHLVLEKY